MSHILVKFSTLRDGVFIEVTDSDEYDANDRCFRFDKNGNAEYAFYSDLISNNPSPRWYAHDFKSNQFLFA